jgi:methyltransferase (TIGR00027 family)
MGRAVANGALPGVKFDDPTALLLLPDAARKRVERVRAGGEAKGFKERAATGYLRRQAKTMAVRTVAVDEAILALRSPQVVILGAGLDGRAWRMSELSGVTVFEVDHPDTQRDKRARASALRQTADEVRFVPVDFQKDALGDALAAAGHDSARATTWVWEGVVMYLAPSDVEATLAAIARRSAPESRLIVVYHSSSLILTIVGPVLRAIGEPLRSTYTSDAMQALLARYGFEVAWDKDLATLGAELSAELGAATKVIRHQRIAVADSSRRGPVL